MNHGSSYKINWENGMRVCDYIAKTLAERGVKHVYGLVGGGTAGLNDGFFCNPEIEFISFHHEQGAGYAALAAARTNKKISVVNVTTGCGGTNAITPCLDAWQESVPMLFLSGNTNKFNTAKFFNEKNNLSLRRYGLQEHDITTTVKNLTKYAVFIDSADDVPYELAKAIYIAENGRPGPVWIDVPGNVQTATIPTSYKTFKPDDIIEQYDYKIDQILEEISKSERPIIVAGQGISISGSDSLFKQLVEKCNIPFVTTFLTRDLLPSNHPNNIGMIGIKGNRAANFAMQNSDLLIILGCSMNVSHIGYDAKSFSPKSKKIMVDIDESELKKGNIPIDIDIHGNVKEFIALLLKQPIKTFDHWNEKTWRWKLKWQTYEPTIHRPDIGGVNLYEIVESFNRNLQKNSCVVVDAGQACYVCSTNLKLKSSQRYMAQAAQGDMGYAVPAAVGIYKTNPELNIVVCIGEGSFFTNVQELAVIKQHKVPVKIFVINNDGYMSIKQTQDKFFSGRRLAVNAETGVNFPNIEKIAYAFDIKYVRINNNAELDSNVPVALYSNEPIIIEVISQKTLDVLPAQAIKPDGTQGGLHDMAPFLSESELKAEMVITI